MTTRATVDRLGRQVQELDDRVCWSLLGGIPVGRFVFDDSSGQPVALPVNHAVDGATVVFRTIPGSKLATAVQGGRASFQADRFDADLHTGWSVLVKGRAELVVDEATELEHRLGGRLQPWAAPNVETLWVRLAPTEITGLALLRPA